MAEKPSTRLRRVRRGTGGRASRTIVRARQSAFRGADDLAVSWQRQDAEPRASTPRPPLPGSPDPVNTSSRTSSARSPLRCASCVPAVDPVISFHSLEDDRQTILRAVNRATASSSPPPHCVCGTAGLRVLTAPLRAASRVDRNPRAAAQLFGAESACLDVRTRPCARRKRGRVAPSPSAGCRASSHGVAQTTRSASRALGDPLIPSASE